MITNIFLGLILGVVITSFIILNNKINNLLKYCSKSFDILNVDTNNIKYVLKEFDKLMIKITKLITVKKSYLNVFRDETQHLSDNVIQFKEKLNVIDADIKFLIISEHKHTRRQIEKQAKISSKINSKRKQSNNTQK